LDFKIENPNDAPRHPAWGFLLPPGGRRGFTAPRAQDEDTRHWRGTKATGDAPGLFRATSAGSAAASEMPALRIAFSLFTRKREKATKRE
jgi:hypothetical protein